MERMSSRPFLYTDRDVVPSDQIVFGTPGGSLNSSGFDHGSVSAGIDGEKRVAAVLDEIARAHPRKVRVFHSVKLPGHFGDIDHVVLVGRTVIAIDTKNWRGSSNYEARPGGTILRDGQAFEPGGKIALPRYIKEVSDFSRLPSKGVLVVANSKSETRMKAALGWDFVNLVTLREVIFDAIRRDKSRDADAGSVSLFARRVVNPSFSGSWDYVVADERSHRPTSGYAPNAAAGRTAVRMSPLVVAGLLAVAFFVAIALANVIGWVLLSVLSLATFAVPVVLRNQGRPLRAPWTLIMVSLGVVGLLGAITSAVIPAAMHW